MGGGGGWWLKQKDRLFYLNYLKEVDAPGGDFKREKISRIFHTFTMLFVELVLFGKFCDSCTDFITSVYQPDSKRGMLNSIRI